MADNDEVTTTTDDTTDTKVDDTTQVDESTEVDDKVHPLEPGGKRFDQVWARAKEAERNAQSEREGRIAAEAKLEERKVIEATQSTDEKQPYTRVELKKFVESGDISEEQADDYMDKVVETRVTKAIERKFAEQSSTLSKTQNVESSLKQYFDKVPNIAQSGTPERTKVDAEYNWLVQIHGEPKNAVQKSTLALNAVRNVLGSIEQVEKRMSGTISKESHQEISGNSQQKVDNKTDVLKDLSPAEKEYYDDLKRKGHYDDKKIAEEVKWYAEKYDPVKKRLKK